MSELLSDRTVATLERTEREGMALLPAQPATGRPIRGRLADGGRFALHLGEMVVAMLVGMELLGVATMLLGNPPGADDLLGGYAYMGAAMAAAMVAWMRVRGHSWADGAEMTAAMLAPMFALVLPVEFGWSRAVPGLNEGSLMLPAHGAMIGGMIVLMLCRWDRYARGHGAHGHDSHRRWSPDPMTE